MPLTVTAADNTGPNIKKRWTQFRASITLQSSHNPTKSAYLGIEVGAGLALCSFKVDVIDNLALDPLPEVLLQKGLPLQRSQLVKSSYVIQDVVFSFLKQVVLSGCQFSTMLLYCSGVYWLYIFMLYFMLYCPLIVPYCAVLRSERTGWDTAYLLSSVVSYPWPNKAHYPL